MIMSDVFCGAVCLRVRARISNREIQSKRCVTTKVQFKEPPVLLTISHEALFKFARADRQTSSRASGSPTIYPGVSSVSSAL